jgi:hypothetical protein
MNRNCPKHYVSLEFYFALLILGSSLLNVTQASAASDSLHVTLGYAAVPLNGPWKFHIGDDPHWADPNFDDSSWETVDLTPASPETHDPDVGLTGYVPGWRARGHSGYFGYAWYRIRVSVDAPQGDVLALCGPFYVDNDYQLFLNGRLLGGAGNFSGPKPVAYSMHLPKIFPLPQSFAAAASDSPRSVLVAVRVWMGPFLLGLPDAGGIHIAPVLGTAQGTASVYHLQWREMIFGYIVDAANAILLLLLAVMVCTLIPLDRSNPVYFWLVAALVLLALRWANQPVFFWWQFEPIQTFELTTVMLFIPLSLAAWTVAWCRWFRLRDWTWMRSCIGILTLLYVISQFLRRSWFYGVFPHWFGNVTYFCIVTVRWIFFLLTLLIIFRIVRHPGREKWFALPAIVLMSIGLFNSELATLHIRGFWFPLGVGLSLSEASLMAFHVALFVLLLHRLYSFRVQPVLSPAT